MAQMQLVRIEREVPDTTELPDVMVDPDPARKAARLTSRFYLNEGNGTFRATNALADDLARLVVLELRGQGLVK